MNKEPDLKAVFQTPGLFVGILDGEGKLIDANQESLDFIDRRLEDVQGEKFWNTPWWDHSEKLREKLKKGMKEAKRGEAVRFEADHISPEGKRITVDFILRSMESKTASTRLLALGRDITERKELEKRKKLVNSSLNQAALEVFWITPGGKFEYTNRKVRKKLGYLKEELEGMKVWEIDPKYGKEIREEQWEKIKDEGVLNFESVHQTKDGETFPVEITSHYVEHGGEEYEFAFAKDITDRKLAEEELRMKERRLRQSFIELAETTSRVLGVRDPYTQQHELRVAELAREVGKRMELDEDRILGIYLGGLLHDIGKITIPENILTKPGKLKDIEWKMIRSHPEVGYENILKDTDFPWPVAEMTLHHHERLDGSGYPDGLKGDELSLEVRILGAVDVVEAMSSRRPYREARTKEEVLEEIKDGRGTKYDPEVVDILVEMIDEGELEFG